MQYKTIVLALLQQQPELHEQLRLSRTLLATMNRYALELKASHEAWMERLGETRPGSDRSQLSSEAMEMAIQELQDRLPCESTTDDDEPLSLDAAMNTIRRHTPPA
jgi:hypothetical protein